MKIAFFEVGKEEKEFFSNALGNQELVFYEDRFDEKNSGKIRDVDILCIFIYSQINKESIEKLPNLKLVLTRSVGFDHIDIEYCKSRGIKVCNLPAYGNHSVAEHAFALILAIARNIMQTANKKNYPHLSLLSCFTLKGKTIGVIGTGRIGAKVIKISNGFGMKVIAYDILENKELEKKLEFRYTPLDELLKSSDIITLHIPLMKETEHLINEEAFRKMKEGAVIINTSRGGIIDTESLITYLKIGKIKAAGLDVIEEEKMPEAKYRSAIKRLLENNNVLITPHMAYYSKESFENILKLTLEIITHFAKKEKIESL